MRFGIALPHIGPVASADAIIDVAQKAEALGFHSIWVLDRLLYPLNAASKYPGNPRGEIPTAMKITYEPFTVLAFAAAATKTILLGTSVLVAAYRNPVLTAKIAATLDQLSGGRLILGLGAGWSTDEFDAVDQAFHERQEKTDEYLRVLKTLWAEEQPCFSGTYYHVPKSIFLPQPLQRPGPPIWIGGNSKRAMRRAAEFGDCWHPTNRIGPLNLVEGMKYIRGLAHKASRGPEAVKPTLRWNVSLPLTRKFAVEEVLGRLLEYREAGVDYVCFDLNIPQPSSLSEMLECMERMAESIFPIV